MEEKAQILPIQQSGGSGYYNDYVTRGEFNREMDRIEHSFGAVYSEFQIVHSELKIIKNDISAFKEIMNTKFNVLYWAFGILLAAIAGMYFK